MSDDARALPPLPSRVRAWGWFMDRFSSMHIATMSPTDIAHNQTMHHVPAPLRRLLFGSRHPRSTAEDRTLPSGIRIRIYAPRSAPTKPDPQSRGPMPALLYLHGGGWTLFGALDMCDWLPSHVAAELGAVVVAVDYRLAPEHPFPAAVDDSLEALDWLAANADALGADPARLAVFGDSAGGNLSAILAQLARDRGGPALAAQALIYPVTDTTIDEPSMHANARSPVLHRADMIAFLDHYLGSDRTAPVRADARAAPMRATSLRALPAALVQVASYDVLRDQGVTYAQRLAAEGTDVRLIEYSESPHGWVTYPTIIPTSRRAKSDLVTFFHEHLRP